MRISSNVMAMSICSAFVDDSKRLYGGSDRQRDQLLEEDSHAVRSLANRNKREERQMGWSSAKETLVGERKSSLPCFKENRVKFVGDQNVVPLRCWN